MHSLKIISILLLYIGSIFNATAQIEFQLTVSSRNIGIDEQLYVEYTLNGTTEDVGMPLVSFNNWNVISGPNTSSNINIINGKKSSSIAYSFALSPRKKGQLVVPSAEIIINGKSYKSNSISVNVGNATGSHNNQQARPQSRGGSIFDIFDDLFREPNQPPTPSMAPGQTPENFMQENNFIKVTPSKKICYIGEPILVTYEFYSGMAAASANVIKQPSFNGVSVIEMTEEKPPYKTSYNGREYLVSRIRQAQIIPLKTGNITLEPAEVRMEILKNDPYGLNATKYATIIKNAPIQISVQPLPPGAPAQFTGNVGQFTITSNVDRTTLPAGETNYMTINISGSGNIDGIKYPDIQFPSVIQTFPYTDSQNVDKQIFPMQATKSFKVPFIGQKQGIATIPAISFSYFDNVENNYKTISTQPITINFTTPLNTGEYERNIDHNGYSSKKWIYLIIGLVALILIFISFFGRKKKVKKVDKIIKPINPNNYNQPTSAATKYTHTQPQHSSSIQIIESNALNMQKEFELLRELINEPTFYSKAKSILLFIIKTKLNTDIYSEYFLMDTLANSSLNNNLKNDFKDLLNKINKGSYLPIVNIDERKRVMETLKYLSQQ